MHLKSDICLAIIERETSNKAVNVTSLSHYSACAEEGSKVERGPCLGILIFTDYRD